MTMVVAGLTIAMAAPESGAELAIVLFVGVIATLLLWLSYFIIY